MHRLALSIFAAFAATGFAQASDLPRAGAPAGCAAPRFAGWYAGLNAGGVNYAANRTDQDGVFGATATYVQKDWGVIAGAQAGYTFASCYALFGGEIDGSWSNVKASTLLLPNTPGEASIVTRFDGLITARTRVGVAFDRLAVFLTSGLALAHTNTTWSASLGAPFNGEQAFNQWRWGWVAGFGSEWAWTERVTIRSEVLYVDLLDRSSSTLFYPAVPQYAHFTHSDSFWISRMGLIVRFGP